MSPSPIRPPQLAVWLVELFVPDEQVQSVLGDLFEEFCDAASKSGLAHARRWYWRQTLPTILHLLGNGLRTAPWFVAGVVIGGIFLVQLSHTLTEWCIREGLGYLDQHVLQYLQPRLVAYLHNTEMYLIRLIVSTAVGCIVALLCKRREMLATLALSLACSIPAVAQFLGFVRGMKDSGYFLKSLPFALLFSFGGLFAIVVGGAIVRRCWLRPLHTASS
jgi:hypothetical protein